MSSSKSSSPGQQPPPATSPSAASVVSLAAVPAPSEAMALGPPGAAINQQAAPALTPAQIAASLADLSHAVRDMQITMNAMLTGHLPFPNPQAAHPPQPPHPSLTAQPPPAALPPPTQPPAPLPPLARQPISYRYGMSIDPGPSSTAPPQTTTPIHMICFPPSPSPIPSWAQGASTVSPPVYSEASPAATGAHDFLTQQRRRGASRGAVRRQQRPPVPGSGVLAPSCGRSDSSVVTVPRAASGRRRGGRSLRGR
jgi:hypothetical protein